MSLGNLLTSVRGTLRSAVPRAVVASRLHLDVYGAEDLRDLSGPVLFTTRYGSPHDLAVLRAALPAQRRRTAIVVTGPSRNDLGLRIGALGSGPRSILVIDADGSLDSVATLATEHGLSVVPVGIRGTAAINPSTPLAQVKGRPRVSVRFGAPIGHLGGTAAVASTVAEAVDRLVAEDVSTWWQTARGTHGSSNGASNLGADVAVPADGWRKVWQDTERPAIGGTPPRQRIWRG